MKPESLILILAGFGLLFLSQARIQQNLDELVFHRMRVGITRMLSHRSSLWLIGIYSSLLLQASRIPSQIATQLVGRRILLVEQAFLLILGATLGSSIKSWFFAAQAHMTMAFVLLCVGSALWFSPKNRLSGLASPLIAGAGFWASLELIWQGLEPLLPKLVTSPVYTQLNSSLLLHQIWLLLFGAVLVTVLRTGTLPVFLVIHMAWSGYLDLEAGVALIMGINLGMGLFTLERQQRKPEMLQLAWCYGLTRILTTVLILFFFPYFIQLCALLVPGKESAVLTAFRLADCHILINVLVAAVGYGSFGLLQRLSRWITRAPEEAHALILSRSVRLMLQRSPEYALQELDNQLLIALEHTKMLTDQNLRMLTDRHPLPDRHERELYLFETIQYSIYDLLLPLYPHSDQAARNHLQRALQVLDHCGQLYFHGSQLYQELQQGLVRQLHTMPEALFAPLERYQTEFNEVWLAILLRRKHFKNSESLAETLELLEEHFYAYLEQNHSSAEQQIWTYRILSLLRQQCLMLYQVYNAQQQD